MNAAQLPLTISKMLERPMVAALTKCTNFGEVFGQHAALDSELNAFARTAQRFACEHFKQDISVVQKQNTITVANPETDPVVSQLVCESLTNLHALAWQMEKIVIRFDATLINAISDSELPPTLPELHLPFDRFYVQLHEPIELKCNEVINAIPHVNISCVRRFAHGFFVHNRTFLDGQKQLALIFIGRSSSTITHANGEIDDVSIDEVVSWLYVNNDEGALAMGIKSALEVATKDDDQAYGKLMRDSLLQVLYLSQDVSDIDMELRNSKKADKVVLNSAGHPRFPREYEVGKKIGRTLDFAYSNSNYAAGNAGAGHKRAHIRRGHFAVRYFGSTKAGRGKGFQQERLVWMKPTLIAGNSVNEPTLINVTKKDEASHAL